MRAFDTRDHLSHPNDQSSSLALHGSITHYYNPPLGRVTSSNGWPASVQCYDTTHTNRLGSGRHLSFLDPCNISISININIDNSTRSESNLGHLVEFRVLRLIGLPIEPDVCIRLPKASRCSGRVDVWEVSDSQQHSVSNTRTEFDFNTNRAFFHPVDSSPSATAIAP